MRALGKRLHPDLPELSYVEVATGPVVIRTMDAGGIDLAILDGEATPTGGMGIAKQLKDELELPTDPGAHRTAATTPGWPTGHAPRPRCRTRSTRSSSAERCSGCCALRSNSRVTGPETAPGRRAVEFSLITARSHSGVVDTRNTHGLWLTRGSPIVAEHAAWFDGDTAADAVVELTCRLLSAALHTAR